MKKTSKLDQAVLSQKLNGLIIAACTQICIDTYHTMVPLVMSVLYKHLSVLTCLAFVCCNVFNVYIQ